MKHPKVYSLFTALLLAFSLNAQQVTIKTPDMSVESDALVHLDVLVEDFEQIIGAQFSLNWDSTVLEFVGVDNFGLPGMTTDLNFGTLSASGGKLRFSWVHEDLSGFTLGSMEHIFSVWFKAIGDPATHTDVSLSNDPITIELVNLSGEVAVTPDNGTVTIAGTSATSESQTEDFILFQNNPNPFTVVTYINFRLEKSEAAKLTIYDHSGKVVFEQNGQFSAGLNTIPVSRDFFQSAGSYFYALETEGAKATRQLTVH